ncbi:MAG: cysteine desulfurase [Firmicutes bacterium]|nr:cysteine desulfurase [Bacillota bacterium]
MKKTVYLDYAATTPLSQAAFSAMQPYFTEYFGNADSLHGFGAKAALALDTARREIARLLNASHEEIFFTSGGTEANNWAVKGMVCDSSVGGDPLGAPRNTDSVCSGGAPNGSPPTDGKKPHQSPHIIVSTIEHSSILQSAAQLEKQGYRVTRLAVTPSGLVDPAHLKAAITDNTVLISIGLANNEIGVIQPIKELAAIAKLYNIPFHTDAVQAAGTLKIDVKDLGVDLLTVSAHKFFGPKGIGVLYINKALRPQPERLIAGGQQERSLRGGTSNVPGAVGMAAALSEACADLDKNYAYVKELRDYFVKRIESEIDGVRLNGDREMRLPQNANFTFDGIGAGEMIHNLDLAGVACASGSACSSGSTEPSHVITALGLSQEDAAGAVRFSFSKLSTREEIDYAIEQIKKTVEKLRGCVTLFAHINTKTVTV